MEAYVFIVSGRVQGVGFRWFTEREALKRNIQGYVRNLEDGRVEVWAQGDRVALDEFYERLRLGPSAARVENVERKAVEGDGSLSSFGVRH